MHRGRSKYTTGDHCCSSRWFFSSMNFDSAAPYLKVMSCSSHSPPASHTGQSSGWLPSSKSMLELLLGNHPLDCPVCDAGGECGLQLGHLLDFHQAHATGALQRQAGV